MKEKSPNLNWTTKDGEKLAISQMATPHLLATIHMIERNRMQNLMSIMGREDLIDETLGYYYQFPKEYEALCDEAERRLLILRGTAKSSDKGLVKLKGKK